MLMNDKIMFDCYYCINSTKHCENEENIGALYLAHLSRRLVGELIVYPWSGIRPRRPASFTISNKNISATSGPIATKFYLKHHWVGGKADAMH